jgi:hypothetical protein
MPFLGTTRVIVVRRTQAMRAPARRALWAVAQTVPDGNTLVLEDLQPPNKRTKPETFGQMASSDAMRCASMRPPPMKRAAASCGKRSPHAG